MQLSGNNLTGGVTTDPYSMLSGGYSSSGDIWSNPPGVNASSDPLSAYKRASAQGTSYQIW